LTADTRAPLSVFLGASIALCCATFLGVSFGGLLAQYVPESVLKKAAGSAFVAIGILILFGKL
jgi:putative Ca2+/H+ antiporter (TMEM165/GDT1 family)